MLYFAYGSNLDETQMARRCPGARAVGAATLRNHALCFAGFSRGWGGAVASIAQRDGFLTQGLLYSVTREHIDALDGYEGHPFVYRRVTKLVELSGGKRARVQTYVHRDQLRFVPGPNYLKVIRSAYKRLGFDTQPLKIAAWGLT